MIQNFKIHIYKSGRPEPQTKITIPLSAFPIAEKLLPKETKLSLEREGIDLTALTQLIGVKGPRGTLIEIESSGEKLIISVD